MRRRVLQSEEGGKGRIVARRLERQAEEGRARNRGYPVRPAREVGPVHQDDADDLAEAERDDGQVIAAQAQGRPAEQDTEGRRNAAGDRQRFPETPAELRRKQRVSIGPDRVEGDVAEVEQAGQPDHHVQTPAEHHVDEHRRPGVDDVAVVGVENRHGERNPERQPADEVQHPVTAGDDRHLGGAGLSLGELAPLESVEHEAQHESPDEDDSEEVAEHRPARCNLQRAALIDSRQTDHRNTQPQRDRGDDRGVLHTLGRRQHIRCENKTRHQTFSTSGRPSRPDGRNINTRIRIEKVATSLYSAAR